MNHALVNSILCGDATEVIRTIPDQMVHCVVTSPPYYGLRDYGDAGQVGLENGPKEYIDRLVGIFSEVRRVLRDDGTLWLNIGDSYAGSGKAGGGKNRPEYPHMPRTSEGAKRKDLLGIPWMLAFALRADGWYLRQDIIWQKPNAMPESVQDRCTKSHEYIFLLSKSPNYYFDAAAIREAAVGFDNSPIAGSAGTFGNPQARKRKGNARTFRGGGAYTKGQSFENSAGVERESHGNIQNETGLRNKRSVWEVATKNTTNFHYAVYPEELIVPCISAGCPEGGTVLDPFMGTGTTAVVAKKLGRNYLGIEIMPANVEYTQRRLDLIPENLFIEEVRA